MAKIRNDLENKNIYITKLNIGGGFPIQYADKLPSISRITEVIHAGLKKYKLSDLKLQCEPGRYLVGESGIIGATIIGRIARQNRDWLFLDVGRFQAFVEMFESEGLRYPLLSSKTTGVLTKNKKYTLTGPSCDSYDTIMSNVLLPSNLDVGDKVYFLSAGSYTTVYGAPFNDFPVPKEHFV
jgi:ornithine decarboxylase